jgi:hypothetical protein
VLRGRRLDSTVDHLTGVHLQHTMDKSKRMRDTLRTTSSRHRSSLPQMGSSNDSEFMSPCLFEVIKFWTRWILGLDPCFGILGSNTMLLLLWICKISRSSPFSMPYFQSDLGVPLQFVFNKPIGPPHMSSSGPKLKRQ